MKEQELALENLRHRILEEPGQADQALWTAVIAFQSFPFYTASGLPFWYTLKRSGGGELIVSRKEGSKTLTRSSILYAFHVVMHGAHPAAGAAADTGWEEQSGVFRTGSIHSENSTEPKGCRRSRYAKEAPMWMLCQDMQAIPAEDQGDIPSYCGPKEIGQIFGISYIYSMFFRFGLIRVPKRVAGKLLNGSDKSPAPIAQEQ